MKTCPFIYALSVYRKAEALNLTTHTHVTQSSIVFFVVVLADVKFIVIFFSGLSQDAGEKAWHID